MEAIPPLPPWTSFELLSTNPDDFAFSFVVKREALGPAIIQRWGWDDRFQSDVHRRHLHSKPFFRIRDRDRAVGTVSLQQTADHIRFGEFYLLSAFQQAGLGTRILRHCLELADRQNTPVRLEYLKWNPVGTLYRRHGFETIGESDIHWFLERPPHPTESAIPT